MREPQKLTAVGFEKTTRDCKTGQAPQVTSKVLIWDVAFHTQIQLQILHETVVHTLDFNISKNCNCKVLNVCVISMTNA